MANKDKAREYLLKEHSSPLNAIMHQCDLKAEMQYHKDIENAFIKGAEWKEKQMVEKAKEFLYENFYEHPHNTGHICTDIDGLHDEDDAMDVLSDSLEKAMMEE